jgi:citrate lyase beta subunit
MLFVPGSRPTMVPKAAASEADAVCLDLEDSVLPEEKAAARANVVRALKEVDFDRRLRIVRINSLDTEFADRDLMEVMEFAGDRVDLVMVPKVASAADIAFVDDILTGVEQAQGSPRPPRQGSRASSSVQAISRHRCRCPPPASVSSTRTTPRIPAIATTPSC